MTPSLTPLPPAPANRLYQRIHRLNQPVEELQSEGLYFYMRKLESSSEAHIEIHGQDLIMLGSNNYLGLTTHPKVKEAAIKAIQKYGLGAGSVRMLGGTFKLHEELEERIARFKGTESAVVYSSGYVANLATLAAFVSREEDIAVVDEKIHASLIDGLRMARAPIRVFDHNNMEDLERTLAASSGKGNLLVIVDGVYSMDGDIAQLPAIHQLAQRYGALVLIDEAHATGVLGRQGRGTPEHFNMHGRVDLIMGTLSKALGGIGGFAAGSKDWVSYLKHHARGFVFSAALPPAMCAGLIAAMDVIEQEPHWLLRLRENTVLLRQGLQQLGYNTGDSQTAIVPVMLGDDLTAYQMTRALHLYGIYVSSVTHPAVPKGEARVRVSVMATHTPSDILKTLEAFQKAKKIVPLDSHPTASAA